MKARLGELGVETIEHARAVRAFMASETARWGKLIQEANLKLN